jgi:hypothetical protein
MATTKATQGSMTWFEGVLEFSMAFGGDIAHPWLGQSLRVRKALQRTAAY